MIDWWQALMLAVVQGLTEFLPISSSAHLIIPSVVLQWPDQGLAFDVAVHLGTLTAVVAFYRRDLIAITADSWQAAIERRHNDNSRLLVCLLLASVPVAFVGAIAGDMIANDLRSLWVIATTTLVFGLVMGYADRQSHAAEGVINLRVALLIGLAQALAPIPGVSRSGITITAALMLGVSRLSAARFSFLLSIPAIFGAGLLKSWELGQQSGDLPLSLLGFGALASGLTAYACISLFLSILERIGLMPFVIYRILLAAALYALAWA